MPEWELTVHAGPYSTPLRRELMKIVLIHIDVWKANQERLIMTLRLYEGGTQNRCS